MIRLSILPVLLTVAACSGSDTGNLEIRNGPQSQSPVSTGGSTQAASSAPVTAQSLFDVICAGNKGNYAGAVAAANATGRFAPAETVEDILGGETSTFRSPDGNIEVIIGTGGPIGDSCGVGTLNPPGSITDFDAGQVRL